MRGRIEVRRGQSGDEGFGILEALAGCLENKLGAVGADAVLDDFVKGVLKEDDEGVEIAEEDVFERLAKFEVGLLDVGMFFVGATEAAAATGELGAGVAAGQDPGAKGR
ncbi:MAG: hypothetical protein WA476_15235 [Acidobacteriaceae bacterium]